MDIESLSCICAKSTGAQVATYCFIGDTNQVEPQPDYQRVCSEMGGGLGRRSSIESYSCVVPRGCSGHHVNVAGLFHKDTLP